MRRRARSTVSAGLLTPAGLPTYRITSGSLSSATRSASSVSASGRRRRRDVSSVGVVMAPPLLAQPAQRRLDCPGPPGYCSCSQMLGSHPAPAVALHRKEAFMRRILAVSFALLFVVGLGLVPSASAQTREESLIYSLQS